MKPYQLIGLNWLCYMHKNNLNAVLADEMVKYFQISVSKQLFFLIEKL